MRDREEEAERSRLCCILVDDKSRQAGLLQQNSPSVQTFFRQKDVHRVELSEEDGRAREVDSFADADRRSIAKYPTPWKGMPAIVFGANSAGKEGMACPQRAPRRDKTREERFTRLQLGNCHVKLQEDIRLAVVLCRKIEFGLQDAQRTRVSPPRAVLGINRRTPVV